MGDIWVWVNGWGEWFGGESFVKFSLLYFIKNSLLNWSGTSSRKIYKRIPCNFDLRSFYKGFPCNFFYVEIFCKFFPTFQTWIGFFSDFFLQNHKTRKLRYLTFHVLHVCQVSGEQKKWPLHVCIFEPKFPKFHHNFPNFQLEIRIFSNFSKKRPEFS